MIEKYNPVTLSPFDIKVFLSGSGKLPLLQLWVEEKWCQLMKTKSQPSLLFSRWEAAAQCKTVLVWQRWLTAHFFVLLYWRHVSVVKKGPGSKLVLAGVPETVQKLLFSETPDDLWANFLNIIGMEWGKISRKYGQCCHQWTVWLHFGFSDVPGRRNSVFKKLFDE